MASSSPSTRSPRACATAAEAQLAKTVSSAREIRKRLSAGSQSQYDLPDVAGGFHQAVGLAGLCERKGGVNHRVDTPGGSGQAEADDLVHDCLVRALDKLHTRREDADIRAWLFTIMHHHFISQIRRRRARPTPEPLDESHDNAVGLQPAQEDALHWRDLQTGGGALPASATADDPVEFLSCRWNKLN